MSNISLLEQAFTETGVQLDRIIDAYNRVIPEPPIPDHPETIVWYRNGTVNSYNIVGGLGYNSDIENMNDITKVEVGNTVTSFIYDNDLMKGTFTECQYLSSAAIPSSISEIAPFTFQSCTALTEVYFPNTITNIDDNAFAYCTALSSIKLPSNLTRIGSWAFVESNLTSINVPDGVTEIGYDGFNCCKKLQSVFLPNTLERIRIGSFGVCESLSSITCNKNTAPIAEIETDPYKTAFSQFDEFYTGSNTYDAGINVLKIPQGATGYDSGAWLDPLQNSEKCGFHIEYI